MHYGEIKNCDIANGNGVRVSLFVSGCTHHCKGCFNQETWDFFYGEPFTREVEDRILSWLKPDYIEGLTILGGEPLEYVNQKDLLPFLRRVRKECPGKNIWCYTGYVFERDILGRMAVKWKETSGILELIDILVDGPCVEEEMNISLRFRGSANQRIIDVKRSLETGKTVLWEDLK